MGFLFNVATCRAEFFIMLVSSSIVLQLGKNIAKERAFGLGALPVGIILVIVIQVGQIIAIERSIDFAAKFSFDSSGILRNILAGNKGSLRNSIFIVI